jgi:thiol-disulfide isomerase/thioredoxin
MRKLLPLGILFLLIVSCSQEASVTPNELKEMRPENGAWKISFISQKNDIPTRMFLKDSTVEFHNAGEIVSLKISYSSDSFFVDIPNFDSHLEGVFQSPTQLKGVFIKDYASDYSIPFLGIKSDSSVFETSNESNKIKQKYTVNIINGSKITPAIGIFEQEGKRVKASFATETGDYRYLEGVIDQNELKLSKFDGSSLQLFKATLKNDSLVNGLFISGLSGNYDWNGVYSEEAELRDPEKLTQLVDGETKVTFSLVDLNNKKVSLSDEQFKGKVKIIQITGTWCPNCLDETRYFTQLYSKYKDEDFEIIAVAFENGSDTLQVLEKLKRYKKNNGIEYTLLYGGKSESKNAEEVFPMLNKVMSFPTAIYLNKNDEVEKIYTGFYGPGTGQYYIDYTKETEKFIAELLSN